jgi:1-phosphofructokinase family hexose kinase
MFLCVSANPAIDKRVCLPSLTRGSVNRATEVHPAPGGKSVHVALALKAFGADPLWLGFAGGSNGDALLRGLSESAIRAVAVPIQESSRMNLEILESDGTVTEILEPGPTISGSEVQSFLQKCEELFAQNAGAYAILSGSLPPSLSDDFYADLIRRAHRHNCRALLDTSGTPLRRALEEQPDFVKPNREEAAWLTSSSITDVASAVAGIRALRSKGARSAAITLGKEGLVWSAEEDETIWFAQSPAVERRSAVGSGDSVLAAFAYALSQNLGPENTLRLAAACGAANCLAESPGKLRRVDVARLQRDVRISVVHKDS